MSNLCPGQRSPINLSGRVPCCKACARLDILAEGRPVARHDGRRWVCDAAVALVVTATCESLVSSRPEAGIARPGPAGLGRGFSAGPAGS